MPLAMLMSLPSCTATSTAPGECAWVKVITVSDADHFTPETARQLLTHNRSVLANCKP